MTELPQGWAEARLDELAEVRLGRQRSPKNHSGSRMRPYLRAANVTWSGLDLKDVKEMNFTEGESAIYELQPGDVLVAEASGSADEVGKPAIWRGEIDGCCFQNTLIRVRTLGPLPEYLRYFLLAEAQSGRIGQASPGVGIHHIGAARLAAWRVPVAPLEEQKRVVNAIDDRLCVMNLLLHGVGSEDAASPIAVDDALKADPGERFDMVLTNPPFGRKSSMTFVNAEGDAEREDLVVVRDDFWASTSNKQLNFLQHVKTLVRPGGRAAIVVPDNVLFEGGAGETVRRRLLAECDVHTMLRLPTGIFYAQGVKANVLFFDRKPASETPWTKELWIYDLRTNQHFTLKQNPLRREHLDDFVATYKAAARVEREESERFKRFGYDELLARDKVSLDISWLRDESLEDVDSLPPPEVIAQEIVEDLEAALAEFSAIATSLRTAGETAE